jgi:ABC-type uncharacterized transport system involved in gliding motility auxiliary subunit
MKPGLVLLPFAALFIAAFSTALHSAFTDKPFIAYIGWGLAAVLAGLWIALDLQNFKNMFKRKGARYGASSGLVVILGLAVVVGLCVVTSRPRFNKSVDLTKTQVNTLSDQSIKIIENIKKKNAEIKILAFFQDEQVKVQFRDLMNLYQAKGGNFNIEYIDPQRDPTKALSEKITAGNTAVFRSGDREARLTTFNEEKITNALVQTLVESKKKIYFTKGHGEGEIKGSEATGYQFVVQELENNKYEVAELNLLEQAKVPDDADLVVIAGPRYDFKEEELRFLEDYLNRGGASFVMIDAVTPTPNLAKSLDKYGIRVNNDILILRPDDPRAALIGQNIAIISTFDETNPITRDFSRQSAVSVLMPKARSLGEVADNPNGMKVSLVAKTAQVMIRVKDVTSENDLRNIGRDRIETGDFAVMAVASGQSKNPAVAAKTQEAEKTDVASEESAPAEKEIRLVAAGSSQFASNAGAQSGENRDLFVNAVNYLLQDEDFISIRPKDADKSNLTITSGTAVLTMSFLVWIYPLLFLGGGIAGWIMRRRA